MADLRVCRLERLKVALLGNVWDEKTDRLMDTNLADGKVQLSAEMKASVVGTLDKMMV